EARIHDQKSRQASSRDHLLPYNVEYQLAQDIAFIAAREEGVHTVSAATVEKMTMEQGLTFTVASNSGVKSSVREGILGIGRYLELCARKELSLSECTEIVFRSVVQLCEPRIIGRLKCKDWNPPAYQSKARRPMHEDLEQVLNRYLSKPKEFTDQMKSQTSRLRDFISFMMRIHQHNSTVTFQERLEALQLAGSVCDVGQSLELALEQVAIQVDEIRMKAIRAFDKVANYRHISERLSRLAGSSKFRRLFQSLRFRFLDNYAPHRVLGRRRFVHAEVQIVTFHRLEGTSSLPMTIGTRNQGFRPFPVQSGIYYVPSLPSLAGTVIAHAALVETASISTVRSISETHSAIARPSMESVGKAVFFSESDRDVVSPLAAASQRPCGYRAASKEQYSKEKESRL
ncbi:MAG: hypothetical protein LQ349_008980, partial [Xanthoria aureola]